MWCIYMGIIYKKTCIINCVLLRQVDASHSALPWHREDESMSGQSSEGNARCRDIYIHIWIFIAVNMEVQWLLFFICVGWGNRFYFDSDSAWISSLVRFTRALTSLALTRPITQQQSGKSADLWIDSRTCLPLLDPCLVPSVQYIYITHPPLGYISCQSCSDIASCPANHSGTSGAKTSNHPSQRGLWTEAEWCGNKQREGGERMDGWWMDFIIQTWAVVFHLSVIKLFFYLFIFFIGCFIIHVFIEAKTSLLFLMLRHQRLFEFPSHSRPWNI